MKTMLVAVVAVLVLIAGCGSDEAPVCPLAGRTGTSVFGADCSFHNGASFGTYRITEQHRAPDGITNVTAEVIFDSSSPPDIRGTWDYGSECRSFTSYVQMSDHDAMITTWAIDRYFRCIMGY